MGMMFYNKYMQARRLKKLKKDIASKLKRGVIKLYLSKLPKPPPKPKKIKKKRQIQPKPVVPEVPPEIKIGSFYAALHY